MPPVESPLPAPPPLAAGIPVFCGHDALVSLHDLKPRPGNPNLHPEAQLVMYAAAIKARGWREAVTVSRLSGFVVKGHGAILAARKLGVDIVPVEYQDYADDDEELADVLAHNRIPELARTDDALLTAALARLATIGAASRKGIARPQSRSSRRRIFSRRRKMRPHSNGQTSAQVAKVGFWAEWRGGAAA